MYTAKFKIVFAFLLFFNVSLISAQDRFPTHQVSINGFRNPSIGLEYQYKQFSVHGGYYTTAFESGVYTNFIKAGATFWFLPVGNKPSPSSFYTSLSYARGINLEYNGENAVIGEIGFRWFVWKGLNLRLGVAALAAENQDVQINPTPGISYTITF